jgi:hypothetical protein
MRFELLETSDGKAACVLQRSYRRRLVSRAASCSFVLNGNVTSRFIRCLVMRLPIVIATRFRLASLTTRIQKVFRGHAGRRFFALNVL